jgi:ABC-type multidrug transport system fused ATPase/permease subunit
LNKQTRVFVTNSLSFLPQVDEIIMLENGAVVEMGSYDALKNKPDGIFAAFIKTYLTNVASDEDDDTIGK